MNRHSLFLTLTRSNNVVYRVVNILCAALLVVMIATVFFQVLGRYVLQVPTPWAQECAVYSFIWIVLLGASLGVRDNSHLVADILPEAMPSALENAVRVFGYLITAVTAFVFLWYGFTYAMVGTNRFSISMGFPMAYLYISMPISGAMMFLFLLERVAAFALGETVPEKSLEL